MGFIIFSFMLGGFFAICVRLELFTPNGDLFKDGNQYNTFFTLHWALSWFCFIILNDSCMAIGNFVLPQMVGALGCSLPSSELVEFLYLPGWCNFGIGCADFGGVDTGWTFYTPYSAPLVVLSLQQAWPFSSWVFPLFLLIKFYRHDS
ncbi:MAG: cbb3-type cytochrome c oxidase subunit I [Bdellovibrionota bacterium]